MATGHDRRGQDQQYDSTGSSVGQQVYRGSIETKVGCVKDGSIKREVYEAFSHVTRQGQRQGFSFISSLFRCCHNISLRLRRITDKQTVFSSPSLGHEVQVLIKVPHSFAPTTRFPNGRDASAEVPISSAAFHRHPFGLGAVNCLCSWWAHMAQVVWKESRAESKSSPSPIRNS